MLQVSRDKNLKIPKEIEIKETNVNTKEDLLETKKAIYTTFSFY